MVSEARALHTFELHETDKFSLLTSEHAWRTSKMEKPSSDDLSNEECCFTHCVYSFRKSRPKQRFITMYSPYPSSFCYPKIDCANN